MVSKGIFDHIYSVNTPLSSSIIASTFKERIETASKETNWFSIKEVNYKKIQADNSRAIIKVDPILFGQLGGIGLIMLHFKTIDGYTKIKALIKPFVIAFWVVIGFSILFTTLFIWLIPGTNKFLFIAFVWLILFVPIYLRIILNRYRITKYLKSVLDDLGIKEDLIKA